MLYVLPYKVSFFFLFRIGILYDEHKPKRFFLDVVDYKMISTHDSTVLRGIFQKCHALNVPLSSTPSITTTRIVATTNRIA